MQRSTVPPPERKKYLRRLREKGEHYRRANCRYWVFEEANMPGAFVEFVEASDSETLAAAMAAAPEPFQVPARTYLEVELD
jgi:hypothetical protein